MARLMLILKAIGNTEKLVEIAEIINKYYAKCNWLS